MHEERGLRGKFFERRRNRRVNAPRDFGGRNFSRSLSELSGGSGYIGRAEHKRWELLPPDPIDSGRVVRSVKERTRGEKRRV